MKRNILLLGAGKSSGSLIDYFSKRSGTDNWQLTVADLSLDAAAEKAKGRPGVLPIQLDIHNEEQLQGAIAGSALVVSLLPAALHGNVAKQCVHNGIHLATASYVSGEMSALQEEAEKRGVVLLNECGLDPGLDHMSAMELIDRLRAEGAEITSFKSYTGGLVAPESNDNPWGYKFSWNPRNVILAGQGTARYIENGEYKYIPYNRLFEHAEKISVRNAHGSADDVLHFDAYANRDSLAYRKIYGLHQVPTLLRGTLRQEHFCKAWNVFVQLGLTDDSYTIEDSEHLTYAGWVQAFLPAVAGNRSIGENLAAFMHLDVNGEIMQMIRWTGILSGDQIGLSNATPAQILQNLLEVKWKLNPADKDMIVMQHVLKYRNKGSENEYEIRSSLIVKGDDASHTAMARTVGLPLASASALLLNNKISQRGVVVPVSKEIYVPVLEEMKSYGILFGEEHHAVSLSL